MRIRCMDSVLCIPYSWGYAHHIYSDLCIPRGHQFSYQMAISNSFHGMHTRHGMADPSILLSLFTWLHLQTNKHKIHFLRQSRRQRRSQAACAFLVCQNIPLMLRRKCFCLNGNDFRSLSLGRPFWWVSLRKQRRFSRSQPLKTKGEKPSPLSISSDNAFSVISLFKWACVLSMQKEQYIYFSLTNDGWFGDLPLRLITIWATDWTIWTGPKMDKSGPTNS